MKLSQNSFFISFFFYFRTIYHFDPTNIPQCHKLQIMATSPTTTSSSTPSPNENQAQNRKKPKLKNAINEVENASNKCDNENSPNDENRVSQNPEIEISSTAYAESDNNSTELTNTISMNTLLSPINQIEQDEEHDNNPENDSEGTKMQLT